MIGPTEKTDWTSALLLLVMAPIFAMLILGLMAERKFGAKRRRRKAVKRLCAKHTAYPHLKIGRMAILDSHNCQVCMKETKK